MREESFTVCFKCCIIWNPTVSNQYWQFQMKRFGTWSFTVKPHCWPQTRLFGLLPVHLCSPLSPHPWLLLCFCYDMNCPMSSPALTTSACFPPLPEEEFPAAPTVGRTDGVFGKHLPDKLNSALWWAVIWCYNILLLQGKGSSKH